MRRSPRLRNYARTRFSTLRHLSKDGTRGFRSGTLRFLPAYDEYLIGYKSRDVVLDPGLAHYAHNDHGIFRPVVALDGEIVGNWKPSVKDGGVTIFKSGVSVPQELIAEQVRGYLISRDIPLNSAF